MKRPNEVNLELEDLSSFYAEQGLSPNTDTEKYINKLEKRLEAGPHETSVNCTPSKKAIEIANMNHSFDDKILMVLSSHITYGSSEGALVSAKEFEQISEDMKYLFKRCN